MPFSSLPSSSGGGGLIVHAEKKAYVKCVTSTGRLVFCYDEKYHGGVYLVWYEYELNTGSNAPEWAQYASNIKEVEFDASFAEARPTSCYQWFASMPNLESICNIEYLNTSNVTNMNSMFYQCSKLASLDLSGFDTKNVNDMSNMFSGCSNLTTILTAEKFVLKDGAKGRNMFAGCTKLKGDISYNSSKVDQNYANVNGGYFTGKGYTRRPWVKYADGTLTFRYEWKSTLGNNEYELNGVGSMPGWCEPHAASISKVAFDESFVNARPVSCSHWFDGCSNLATIEGLEYLNTSNVTDMQYLFSGCIGLQTLDLETFNTGNVTNMSNMFADCSNLQTIYAKESFTNSKVISADDMFKGCSKLEGDVKFSDGNIGKEYATLDGGYLKDKDTPLRPWVKLKDGVLTFQYGYHYKIGDNEFLLTDGEKRPEWFGKGSEITKVVFDKSFGTVRPTSCYQWFSYCSKLSTIEGIENLNTSLVTTMNCMFGGCSKIGSFDLSNFDTSNVTDMVGMFAYCSKLTSLDLSNFDTSKVTTMLNMFYGCSMLTSLDLSKFNTSEVTNMKTMFTYCSKLTSLDLSSFDTSSVTDMQEMFRGCSLLTTIYVSDAFVLKEGVNGTNMFTDCRSLKGDIEYDRYNTGTTYAKSEGGYFIDRNNLPRPWVSFANGTLTFQYGVKKQLGDEEYLLNEGDDEPGWYYKHLSGREINDIYKVVFDESFAQARPTTCCSWFFPFACLETIEGIQYLNTSNVTNMNRMFARCYSLTSLDLSNFDTSNVTSMNSMFEECYSLSSLDLSNFDTSNVTDMGSMFNYSNLTSLDLSSFDTQKVEVMWDMFNYCIQLTSVYLGEKFSMDKVKKRHYSDMFKYSPVVVYSVPNRYEALRGHEAFGDRTMKPYVSINPKSKYGTLCVPVGSSLAEGSFTGFDKLYQVQNADKDKGTITMVEAMSIEPGVPYVYHRFLEGVNFESNTEDSSSETTSQVKKPVMSVITYDVDENASSAVTAPKNENSLLKGTFESMLAKGGSYILQTDGNFHPVAADNKTLMVGAYRAYLDLPSLGEGGAEISAKAYRMVFEDGEATGIDRINGEGYDKGVYDQADQQPKVYFDLMGRKVNAPQKGEIYIVNSKKVIYNK